MNICMFSFCHLNKFDYLCRLTKRFVMHTIKIRQGKKDDSKDIAKLIMIAMNYDCCKYFAGKNHTLHDFEIMMTELVNTEESQYSYKNTIVAMIESDIVGVCVSYDGAELHHLRKAFINAAKKHLDGDFSAIDDETQAGELYVDSLAVKEQFRHNGIATAMLDATKEKARKMNIRKVGLLVDKGNPEAEQLYKRVGFLYENDSSWGGHPMKHLVKIAE